MNALTLALPRVTPPVSGWRPKLPTRADLEKALVPHLVDLLARGCRLRIARSPEEREAIYRFRYDIYVAERNRVAYAGADPVRKRIFVPEDEAPGTEHYYVAQRGRIAASVRYSRLVPDELPADVREGFGIDELPGLDRLRLCTANAFSVAPDLRGGRTGVALLLRAAEHFVAAHGIEAFVMSCAPGLVSTYQRVGFRDFGAGPRVKDVALVPLVLLTGDLEHHRRTGSVFRAATERAVRRGVVTPLPAGHPVMERLERQGRIVTSPEGLRAELATAPTGPLHGLSEAATRRLLQNALAMDVPAGTRLTAQGIAEKEAYLALGGRWEIRRGDQVVRTAGAGALLGARAAFTPDGRRPESVVAVDGGRVLLIRHSRLRAPRNAVDAEVREALLATLVGLSPA
ncbi:MAG: hypothetical protein H6738_03025 [Alphaproteobacteria bacterium]|nr:hypothetical protein [Alphaproteobacteria bacterium]MCB9695742.1 hypothetical protein [Alphaproteobacteria bacterium]